MSSFPSVPPNKMGKSGFGSRANQQAAHRVAQSDEEYTAVCWLRCNPKTAASYGITSCKASTRVGSMLLQVLAWMCNTVKWKEVAAADTQTSASGNVRAAAFVDGMKVRSGRKPTPRPQPPSGAPPEAAVFKKNPTKRGRPPRISFPLLVRLARTKRKRQFTSRGNLIAAPGAVALVQVSAQLL